MCWRPRWVDQLLTAQHHITNRLDLIVALVSVDQTVLDSIGTELAGIADAVQGLVNNPNVPLDAGDLSSITDAVSRIETSLTKPEAPVEPADPTPPAA